MALKDRSLRVAWECVGVRIFVLAPMVGSLSHANMIREVTVVMIPLFKKRFGKTMPHKLLSGY